MTASQVVKCFTVLFGILTGVCILYCQLTDIFWPGSHFYNEGPLLDQALRLTRGESIYRSDANNIPYTVSNYGPIFQWLQTPFINIFGTSMLYGRIISAVSNWITALLAGAIIKHFTRSNISVLLTFCLVISAPMSDVMLYRVDPLAQALSLSAVYIAIRYRHPLVILCSIFLFVCAIYTKQSYLVAGPLTTALYLWLEQRKKAATIMLLSVASITLVIFAIGNDITRGGLVFNLLTANINIFLPERAVFLSCIEMLLLGPLILASPIIYYLQPSSARRFCFLYFTCALVPAIAIGKVGSNYGYFSELLISIALCVGLAFARFPKQSLMTKGPWICLILLQLVCNIVSNIDKVPSAKKLESEHQLQALIQVTKGEILADRYMGLVVLEGKPVLYQPFEMMSLLKSGHWNQTTFVQQLNERHYKLIVRENIPENNQRYAEFWSPEMLEAISHNYRQGKPFDEYVHVYIPLQ